MAALFWLSVTIVAYVYIGYPILLRVWARWRPAPPLARADQAFTPGVSIVIAARNEAARLAARLDNLLALDYPADRRQIIVVSDGSTDDSMQLLSRYAPAVVALAVPPGGKAAALNAGVAAARFEVVVFADARQVFALDALRHLVAPFADPRVGGVTGELLLDCESALFANRRSPADRRSPSAHQYASTRQLGPGSVQGRTPTSGDSGDRRRGERRCPDASTIADGVGLYWRYEKELRRLESAIGSTLGATGAIYAIRRALWRPLPADTLLDDVLAPMRVVLAGYRVVFNAAARAFDRAPADVDAEKRRKVRTLAGNYQILRLEPRLLAPWRNPVWVQYASHKLGRLVVPYAMLAIFASSLALAAMHVFYLTVVFAQVAFYLLAAYGAILELNTRPVAAPVTAPPTRPMRAEPQGSSW